ncbi:MAG: hypothetical protein JSS12_02375 [Verrucomicrobia bacterium]|nr:hypothetical protein [Verrucomicrobiota bacterium]
MIPDATYTFSAGASAPPAVEKKGNRTVATLSLTIEEMLYLKWMEPAMRDALSKKVTCVFLGASQQMQQMLIAALQPSVNQGLIPQENLNLNNITGSIATKVSTFVKNKLGLEGNQNEIDADKAERAQALLAQRELNKSTAGSTITSRDATVLLIFLKNTPMFK